MKEKPKLCRATDLAYGAKENGKIKLLHVTCTLPAGHRGTHGWAIEEEDRVASERALARR